MLANYLKGVKSKQYITQIQTVNSSTTTDHTEINEAFKDYFAISFLQSGKSPGLDGSPAEFFKTFSSSLTLIHLSYAMCYLT